MSRLKAGDYVRIKRNLNVCKCYRYRVNWDMVESKGKYLKVTRVCEDGITLQGSRWYWSMDMFEDIFQPTFEVGQKVIVSHNLYNHDARTGSFGVNNDMMKYRDAFARITGLKFSEARETFRYSLNIDNGLWGWADFMLERITEVCAPERLYVRDDCSMGYEFHLESRMISCREAVVLVDRCGEVAKAVDFNCGLYTYKTRNAQVRLHEFYPKF